MFRSFVSASLRRCRFASAQLLLADSFLKQYREAAHVRGFFADSEPMPVQLQ